MEEIKSFNKVELVGYVIGFKVYKFKSGKRKAEIGIKDRNNNNVCYVQMFENDKMKYAGQSVNLDTLNRIFMDADGKPRGVLVSAVGRVAENVYLNAKTGVEAVSCKPIIRNLDEFNTSKAEFPDKMQHITFELTGIVENIRYVKEDTEVIIRMGIPTTNRNKEFDGVEYLTCYADGTVLEKIEEAGIEKGYQISIAGDILNKLPQRDFYGEIVEGSVGEKGFKIRVLKKKVVEADDLPLEQYQSLKSGNKDSIAVNDKTNEKPSDVDTNETEKVMSSDVQGNEKSFHDNEKKDIQSKLDF